MIAMLTLIRGNKALAAVLGGVGLLLAAYAAWLFAVHLGSEREAKRQEQARAAALVQSVTIDSAAKEVAAEERQKDARRLASMEEELKRADDKEDDNRPSAASIAYLCGVRAQQPGGSSKLPAACRSRGGR